MDKPKDGGFAFPHPGSRTAGGDDYNVYPELGMTLRDYFAAHALSEAIADAKQCGGKFSAKHGGDPEAIAAAVCQIAAQTSYAIADAMIAARQSTSMEGGEG